MVTQWNSRAPALGSAKPFLEVAAVLLQGWAQRHWGMSVVFWDTVLTECTHTGRTELICHLQEKRKHVARCVVGLLVELALYFYVSDLLVVFCYCIQVSFFFYSVIWLWQDWLGMEDVARHWEVVLPFLHAGDSCSYRVEPPGRCTPHCCCLGSVGGPPSACEGVRTNPSTSGCQAMSLEV